jgi:fibronectin-binding autotransporter adhesin
MRQIERRRFFAVMAIAATLLAASPGGSQTVVWTGAGPNSNFSTGANWAGGSPPPNDGSNTVDLGVSSYASVGIDTGANIAGLVFLGSSGYSEYNLFQVNGGSLTIGGGGISTPGGISSYLYSGAPVILSADQAWGTPGFIYVTGPISEVGGSRALTMAGSVYLLGNNTFTGGLDVASGTFYAGSSTAAGTGTITLEAGSSMQSWYAPVTLSNPVVLNDNVTLGSNGFSEPLTLSGTVTLANANTTLLLGSGASVSTTGSVAGPPSASLALSGFSSAEPIDGGSRFVIQGTLSNVSSLSVAGAQLILAPAGDPVASFPNLSPSGVQVSGLGYLGLDGTFVNPGAVAAFVSTYGPTLGPNMNGTLGFDTVADPSTPNIFADPINLGNFSSEGFVGLGSATAAILTGPITPAPAGYLFGGGGGTLTVKSDLPDVDGTPLLMGYAPSPVTVILQGSNTYSGGTTSRGGALIFDSPTPASGAISLFAGYVGYTERATNIATAQQFVSLFNTSAGNGVIGFDSAVTGSPRSIGGAIDLSAFNSSNVPFIGTATAVTLAGPITPANNQYQFTGVKGGVLTVASNLTDGTGSSLTVGLPNPIESSASVSRVVLTGNNSFTLGTTFNSGALFINNDNALGTGPIAVPDTDSTTIVPSLVPFGGNVTLANPISVGSILGGPGLILGNNSTFDVLVLNGAISDYSGSGQIAIDGSVTLAGVNTYSGGTALQGNAILLVANPSSLGTGPVTVESSAVIAPNGVDVALPNPVNLYSQLTLGQSGNVNKLTMSGVISSGGNLVIESAAELDGANTFSGGTLVDDADLTIGNVAGLGNGPLQLVSSMLTFTPAVTTPTILDLTGDSGSTIVLRPASTLTLDTDLNTSQPAVYSGTIQGDSATQVVKVDAGASYLGGNSTYGGGTAVNGGVLIAGVSGSLGTGPVSVAAGAQLGADSGATLTNVISLSPGATLSGSGTFSPPGGVTFAGGATVMPGNPVGGQYVSALSFGTPVTFGTGGIYSFSVATASGSAGIDYSTLNVAGSLTISSTAVSPFIIAVTSINPGSGSPGMANFNPAQAYSWTLVTAGSIPVFNPADFSVNTANFQNSLGGGSFLVGEAGNLLTLDFTPVPEPSTWVLMLVGLAAAGEGLRRRRGALGQPGTTRRGPSEPRTRESPPG